MTSQYNPFKENRTEQMRDLWKYYVPFPGLDGASKPIVVQGGRGSGKTMFFQCNSWREVLSQLEKNNCSVEENLDSRGFVGIYYRVDTTFVSAMRYKDENNWAPIFETYLCICILQEMLDLLIALDREMKMSEYNLSKFASAFSKKLCPDSDVKNIQSFRLECDLYLDAIEDKINGISHESKTILRWVSAHRFISDLCKAFNSLFGRELLFKIFVDEYETLQDYQQRIINTLIKHSTLPVIFNIGLRPKGMKTIGTISDTETIEAPHDYELLTLEFDPNTYPEMIRSICKKRISLGKEQGKIPSTASEDIETYLGQYTIQDEIGKMQKTMPHIEKLKKLVHDRILEDGISPELENEYVNILCNCSLLESRIHYALLCKKTSYTPSLSDLYEGCKSRSERYMEWIHSRKFGAVFLLCKEAKREKMYYGIDVFLILSSNIVRYFLELCEQTFRMAFQNGFSWDGAIDAEIQNEAAHYVSEYKIVDIAGYEPYGKELRIFVQYLGQIFYKLHTAENTTLGEPEPNHFNTKDLSLPDYTRKLLDSAIMCNVLQEGEPTKRKQSKLSPETVDYYLNKIYVPYFGISYRNQRKIQIEVGILEKLFSGNEDDAKMGFQEFFKRRSEVEDTTPGRQLSLFKDREDD